jgi:hypothetical protein
MVLQDATASRLATGGGDIRVIDNDLWCTI